MNLPSTTPALTFKASFFLANSYIIFDAFVNEKDLKVLATLPDKNGMVAMLLSVLQAPIRNLACVVKAVSEKEEN